MSEPFVGEIRMFAGGFAPRGWSLCDGQLLAVSQNDALFSLFGTIYGGDGRTTFGLPDLRGRIPMHKGSGPGLTPRALGHKSGQETVTLTINQLPNHTHRLSGSTSAADSTSPAGRLVAKADFNSYNTAAPVAAYQPMNSASITNKGGSQQHTNLMPFQCINYIVALVGVYPSRS